MWQWSMGFNLPLQDTPQKFNMEPEKKSLEEEIPFGNHHFSGSMLNLEGVNAL